MRARWKRGAVLLQTLVMAVILSMIAIMVTKWILARYLMEVRGYRAVEAKARAQIVTDDRFSTWNPWNPSYPQFTSIPTEAAITASDGSTINYSRTALSADGMMTFTVTTTPD